MIEKYPKVSCDNCKKDFKLKPKHLKKKVIDNIEVRYFVCRHCKTNFIYGCIDEHIASEQNRYQDLALKAQCLQKEYGKNNSKEVLNEFNKIRIERTKCLKDMKKYSDDLSLKIKDKL